MYQNPQFRKGLKLSQADKSLDWFKFDTFTDDNVYVAHMVELALSMVNKHFDKRSKCWLPPFSPFPTMFPKSFSLQTWDCRGKGRNNLHSRPEEKV